MPPRLLFKNCRNDCTKVEPIREPETEFGPITIQGSENILETFPKSADTFQILLVSYEPIRSEYLTFGPMRERYFPSLFRAD